MNHAQVSIVPRIDNSLTMDISGTTIVSLAFHVGIFIETTLSDLIIRQEPQYLLPDYHHAFHHHDNHPASIAMEEPHYQADNISSHWSSWSGVPACSRPCDLSITTRHRQCLQNGSKSMIAAEPYCEGSSTQVEICHIKECLRVRSRARFRQCTAYNRTPYRGKFLKWRPLKERSGKRHQYKVDPCALVCMTKHRGTTIIVKFRDDVIEGTSCYPEEGSTGVCFQKKCVPTDCKGHLYSHLKIDRCGICDGKGDTCRIVHETKTINIYVGYNTIVNLSIGSRNIHLIDVSNSPAVFAVRNQTDIFFVNGRHQSKSPTVYPAIAGSTFYYHHPFYSKDRTERLKSQGPLTEPLVVMMFSAVNDSVTVRIKYTIPLVDKYPTRSPLTYRESQTEAVPYFLPESSGVDDFHMEKSYDDRKHENNIMKEMHDPVNTTETAVEDGAVENITNAYDYETNMTSNASNATVDGTDNFNTPPPGGPAPAMVPPNAHVRPPVVTEQGILYNWKTDKMAPCSATCNTGVQTKFAQCYRSDGVLVADDLCDEKQRPSPHSDHCKGRNCNPRWVASTWSKCSVSCGEGVQYRSVHCWLMMAPGFDSTVHDFVCSSLKKPALTKQCQQVECGPVWEAAVWSQCSHMCGPGIKRRGIRCSSNTLPCDPVTAPPTVQRCNNGPCHHNWIVSDWSECSGACGKGLMRRSVTCRDTETSEFVHDKYCDDRTRPLTFKACGDQPSCPPVWVSQDWGVCSVHCGEGITTRRVICGVVEDEEFAITVNSECGAEQQPATRARCREPPCSAVWYTTAWSQCSMTCGEGGQRMRKVTCYFKGQHSLQCDHSEKPVDVETCQLPPCMTTPADECVDDAKTDCPLVVQFNLCGHWYYKRACCLACLNSSAPSPTEGSTEDDVTTDEDNVTTDEDDITDSTNQPIRK